jgi:hypothetical protein
MHGRDGGGASVWRIQYVWDGFEDRREGLFTTLFAGEVDRGEGFELKFALAQFLATRMLVANQPRI